VFITLQATDTFAGHGPALPGRGLLGDTIVHGPALPVAPGHA